MTRNDKGMELDEACIENKLHFWKKIAIPSGKFWLNVKWNSTGLYDRDKPS
jgi:hypothetical protein